MTAEKVFTEKAPAPIGPYSQAISAGDFVFTAGQIPLIPGGDIVPGGPAEQARQALENLGAVLKAAGCTYDDVVKTTVFLTDMANFAAVNEVYAQFFVNAPARSTVAVAGLPKGALVEIEAIAAR